MPKSVKSTTAAYTFEDFCDLINEDQKADLIDGVIYMASPDNTDANELFMWLGGLMDLFAEENDLGKVYGTRVAFRLDKHNGPEPDLGFVQKARLHLVERGFVRGGPDLAVEIVSPESVERDYEKKRKQYEDAKIPEYWIVDEIMQQVTLLRLGKDGKYRAVKPKKGVLASNALPGFWLRLDWLWQDPLPRKTTILKEILGRDL
ncbi:MAG TPA: Uma2 family endonuclease [Gemmataceae bacterium]|nr:Uma2 family endonuclease [Gemmataceae bacterium]